MTLCPKLCHRQKLFNFCVSEFNLKLLIINVIDKVKIMLLLINVFLINTFDLKFFQYFLCNKHMVCSHENIMNYAIYFKAFLLWFRHG